MPATPTGPGPQDSDEPSGQALQRALFDMFRDAAGRGEDERAPEAGTEDESRTAALPEVAPEPEREPEPEEPTEPEVAPLSLFVDEPAATPEAAEPVIDLYPATATPTTPATTTPATTASAAEAPLRPLTPRPAPAPAPQPVKATTAVSATGSTDDPARRDRRLLTALAVAVVLTLVAGVGSLLLTRGDDADEPSATPSPSAPPSADPSDSPEAALLAQSRATYDEVAVALSETPDLASLPDAVALATAALPAADAQTAEAATLDPAPSEQAVALLAARRAFLGAVAALADLDTAGLSNFGDLATGLRASAQQLDEAEVTQELAAEPAGTPLRSTPERLVLVAAPTVAADVVAAAQAADHVGDLVAAEAGRTLTDQLTSLLERLTSAGLTADVRGAADDAGALASYAGAARAGFSDDTETAAALDALLALLDPIGGLSRLDGENLDVWTSSGSLLRDAADGLPDPLAGAARAAYGHLDGLVTDARATLAAWEQEVEAARAAAPTPSPTADPAYATYARAVEQVIARHRTLLGGLPTLAADGRADYTQGTRLFDAAGAFRSLGQQARAVSVPSGLASAHQTVVALVDAGQSAAYQGHLTSLEAEQCAGRGGSASACRLGAQRSFSAYTSALGSAQRTDAVESGVRTAIAAAGTASAAPAPDVTLPPRPEV
ncbi:hypothetical protein [Nocardioides alkalitolerans]|uniref:hypothetical protein n=1 Tax=Nocardioides alkalitolerans TaxID=281714 RepID=UPI0003FE05AD|nr:hypothetical protein [Nocardioides alkalitolerans]